MKCLSIIWQIFIIIAILFRFEAIVFLIGLPVVLMFLREHKLSYRLILWLYTNTLSITFITILVFFTIYQKISIAQLFPFFYVVKDILLIYLDIFGAKLNFNLKVD